MSTARAGEGPASVRAELGSGIDTNVKRVEGPQESQDPRETDGVVRAVLDVRDRARPHRRVLLTGGYHLGAKHFYTLDSEDALFQRVEGVIAVRIAASAALRLDADIRDRTSRDPAVSRDFSRVVAGPGVDLRLGRLRLGARMRIERFLYAPDDRVSATGYGGTLRLSHPVGPVELSARGGILRRRFDGDRRVRVGFDPEAGAVLTMTQIGARREDTLSRVGVGISHVGAWVGRVDYTYETNDSNSHGSGFDRQTLSVSGHVTLPWRVVVSGLVSLQRVVHDEPQNIARELFVEDEGRSAIALRLERPITETLAVVAHAGYQFSPGGTGPDYQRQTTTLGLAYARDR